MIDKVKVYKNITQKRIIVVSCSFIVLLFALIVDLSTGSSNMTLANMIGALFAGPKGESIYSVVVWNIRLPMTLTCFFVGASLSISGLQLQVLEQRYLSRLDFQ